MPIGQRRVLVILDFACALKHFSHPHFSLRLAVAHALEEFDRAGIGPCGIDKSHAHAFFVHAPLHFVIKLLP